MRADDGSLLILDAGTGLRALGATLGRDAIRIDILLSHLHLGHLQGLGFFAPLYDRRGEVHLWGPPSPAGSLRARLGRYLSPPLFPVRLRDLGPQIVLHELPPEPHSIGPFRIRSAFVIHPGPTVGYRIIEGSRSLAHLPDHERRSVRAASPSRPAGRRALPLRAAPTYSSMMRSTPRTSTRAESAGATPLRIREQPAVAAR